MRLLIVLEPVARSDLHQSRKRLSGDFQDRRPFLVMMQTPISFLACSCYATVLKNYSSPQVIVSDA